MVFSKEKRNKKVFIKNFKKKWSIHCSFFDGKIQACLRLSKSPVILEGGLIKSDRRIFKKKSKRKYFSFSYYLRNGYLMFFYYLRLYLCTSGDRN